ncbi:hypothetical protein Vi05172_g13490 [Venturia inaequalis]|nr:hypothetical protein Vi05172_g13490 [Venturia inaequalis]
MHLTDISSTTVLLLLYITPSLAYACCRVDDIGGITKGTHYTASCCRANYQFRPDSCAFNKAGQKAPMDSCCTDGGKRTDVRLCAGQCVIGSTCERGTPN